MRSKGTEAQGARGSRSAHCGVGLHSREPAEKVLAKSSGASINETLRLEQATLTITSSEIAEVKTLSAPADLAPALAAALAEDQEPIGLLRSMIARPDSVRLSLTLPRRPNLAPPWQRSWNVRVHALAAEARAKSSQLVLPGLRDVTQLAPRPRYGRNIM